jgi:hypothetical protein
MRGIQLLTIGLALLGLLVAGCERSLDPVTQPNTESADDELQKLEASAMPTANSTLPSPLVTASVGDAAVQFWPYTGNNFSGIPQDPINLIFFGQADPRDIRAALLSLDGDRSALGFPAAPPFNSTWDDAIGDEQTAYGAESGIPAAANCGPKGEHSPDRFCTSRGWTGSSIQLACGPYEGMRFHLRLFKIGNWTVANAHLDVLIPGTTDHQVISWEVAEQFVIADFLRSGLLDQSLPMIPTDQINEAPFRTIPAVIYNGLPIELRVLVGGPTGNVTADVPIGTDGRAMILNLSQRVSRVAEVRTQDFVINFNQAIPKPFCSAGPADYVFVTGPVHLRQTAKLSRAGVYEVYFQAIGELNVTPIDPSTGQPTGATLNASVREIHQASFSNCYFSVISSKYQKLGKLNQPEGGRTFTYLQVTSPGLNAYTDQSWCGSDLFAKDGLQDAKPTSADLAPGDLAN